MQHDIKRVVAYSTLSQLGYMTVALGASAYAAGIFHLMTHAFFKALLFLAAGSVIIAMHHEQDIRKMGGLRKYMPITYWTSVIGTLALIGFPGFAGFFSKDALIEAVHASTTPGHAVAYWAVLLGVFVTSLYSFRMLFVVFHGEERMDHHTKEHLHETPWVVTVPLIALAIPSVVIGWLTIGPVLFGDYFDDAIFELEGAEPARARSARSSTAPAAFVLHAFTARRRLARGWRVRSSPGSCTSSVPTCLRVFSTTFGALHRVLMNKYYFDWFNENVLRRRRAGSATVLWKVGDQTLIDGALVNGTARRSAHSRVLTRGLQTGYLYHYAFAMIIGPRAARRLAVSGERERSRLP